MLEASKILFIINKCYLNKKLHILICKYLNINIRTVIAWKKWSRECVHNIRILKKKNTKQNTSKKVKKHLKRTKHY